MSFVNLIALKLGSPKDLELITVRNSVENVEILDDFDANL